MAESSVSERESINNGCTIFRLNFFCSLFIVVAFLSQLSLSLHTQKCAFLSLKEKSFIELHKQAQQKKTCIKLMTNSISHTLVSNYTR